MAPLPPPEVYAREFDLNKVSKALEHEWKYPSNQAFMILLLLGGDVVSKALGQLAGGPITPVAFSFGWVGYAMMAINSAVGQNKLMPAPDTSCLVINAKSRQSRANTSWVLGRVMRDFEHWQGEAVAKKTREVREQKQAFDDQQRKDMQRPTTTTTTTPRKDVKTAERAISAPESAKPPEKNETTGRMAENAGLVVSFWSFDAARRAALKRPGRDLLFWSGVFVSVLQLGIAAIPFGIYGDWGVFMVTAAAVVLCLVTGAAPQWRQEKWKCREIREVDPGRGGAREEKAYFLTRGNGAQHALYIEGRGCGLNLEDLSSGFDNIDSSSVSPLTRIFFVALGVLWVCLLLTSAALVDQAWFLIAVGGIGMLQNIMVAGLRRDPEALGVPLKYEDVIGYPRVIDTVYEMERRRPKAGWALAGTFFPGGLRDHEKQNMERIARARRDEEQAKTQTPVLPVKKHD